MKRISNLDPKLVRGSTAKYRDRPTDDGMRGDGADEPNEGAPRLPKQTPSRRVHRTHGRTKAGTHH